MSTREGLSTVREPDRPEAYEDDLVHTDARAGCVTRRRTEKRFEIGFFIRRRVGRALAFYRQFALARARSKVVPVPQTLAAPLPPPPASEEGEETGGTTAMKAFSVRSSQGQGTGTGDTSDEPAIEPAAVMPDDDGGPIHGTSYEIGAFASTTTETTTDGA